MGESEIIGQYAPEAEQSQRTSGERCFLEAVADLFQAFAGAHRNHVDGPLRSGRPDLRRFRRQRDGERSQRPGPVVVPVRDDRTRRGQPRDDPSDPGRGRDALPCLLQPMLEVHARTRPQAVVSAVRPGEGDAERGQAGESPGHLVVGRPDAPGDGSRIGAQALDGLEDGDQGQELERGPVDPGHVDGLTSRVERELPTALPVGRPEPDRVLHGQVVEQAVRPIPRAGAVGLRMYEVLEPAWLQRLQEAEDGPAVLAEAPRHHRQASHGGGVQRVQRSGDRGDGGLVRREQAPCASLCEDAA